MSVNVLIHPGHSHSGQNQSKVTGLSVMSVKTFKANSSPLDSCCPRRRLQGWLELMPNQRNYTNCPKNSSDAKGLQSTVDEDNNSLTAFFRSIHNEQVKNI